LILENVLTVFSGWMPLFAILVLYVPLRSKIWLPLTELSLIAVSVSLFFIRFSNAPDQPLYSLSLVAYPLSMAVMLPLFHRKYDFNRALALTLCLGFLLTGLHEVWGFVRLDLGFYDDVLALKSYAAWFTPLDHLYYVVVAALALWISRFSRFKALSLFGWFLLGLALEWIIYPNLALDSFGAWDIARRMLWLPILLIIFYKGGKDWKTLGVGNL
jgi:hypothetical protein